MWPSMLNCVLFVWIALQASVFGQVLKKIEAPCTACKAVAAELQRRIDKEPVRNHLDLRHRLDKDGQRYGKVIAYRSSELRAVELLDGLCDRMRDYSLVSPKDKRTKFWLKVKGDGAQSTANVTRPSTAEEDNRGKRLEAYCGTLVEEYEEDIYAGIMKGGFDTHGVEPVLCRGIISPCPTPAAVTQGPGDPADSAEEAPAEEGDEEGEGEAGDGSVRYIDNLTITGGKDGTFEL